ncbi:MAG: hypothetical protein IKO00_13155 [Oscillospiraceae bacterium]|nr:hypothetical protein [Oscillospiraceae bacterium]
MEDNNKTLNNNGMDGQDNGGEPVPKEKGFFTRAKEAVQRGYYRAKSTRIGRVVIGGSKIALMGLGAVKAWELTHQPKKEEPAAEPETPALPEQTMTVELPAAEPVAETATETVAEQQ